jgi:hypothetical protein
MEIAFWTLGVLATVYLTVTLGLAWFMRKPRY